MGLVFKIILIHLVAIVITVLSVMYFTSATTIVNEPAVIDSTLILCHKIELLLIESNRKIDSLNNKNSSTKSAITYNNYNYVKNIEKLPTKSVMDLDSIIFLGTGLSRN